MVKKIYWKENLTHSQWLKERLKIQGVGEPYTRVSASDISVITGSNVWKSKRRLFLQMTGLYHRDIITPWMAQGSLVEPVVGQYYESWNPSDKDESLYNVTHGIKLRKVEKAKFFLLNTKYEHLSASLDFIHVGEQYSPISGAKFGELSPIEAKYLNEFYWKSMASEGISQAYLEQMQIQLGLAEESFGIFAPLVTDGSFNPREVYFDKELFEYLVEVAGNFARDVTKVKLLMAQKELSNDVSERTELEYMIEESIPLDDGHKDALEVINETHEGSIDELYLQIEDGDELDVLMSRYIEIQEEEKILSNEKNKVRSQLTLASDGYSGIESPNFRAIIRGDNSDKKRYFRILKKGDSV